MKLKLKSIVFLLAGLVFIASCGKKSDVPVPADAGFVLHINGSSLNSKLSWDEIKQSEWYKILQQETSDSLAKQVLSDPATSGVDLKSDLYVFVRTLGKRGSYTGVVGNLTDEAAFANFVERSTKGQKSAKEGDLSVVRSNESVVTWKGKRFVVISNVEMENPNMGSSSDFDADGNGPKFSADSLLVFANETYNIKGNSSVGKDDRFTKMLGEKGDMHLWINAGSMYGGAMPAELMLTKAEILFKDNVTAATINFDNGKITFDGKSYYNKELEALYKKHEPKNLDENMLKMIPGQNVAAVFAMNYPPQGLKEFLAVLGVEGLINGFLAQEGFSVDDFVRANKGDILFAVSDFGIRSATMPGDTVSVTPGQPGKLGANILFATSVNDTAAFRKLMDIVLRNISKMGGEKGSQMASLIPYQLKNNWFIAGSDMNTLNAFGTATADHAFIGKIKGHPAGAYVDVRQFINGWKPSMDSVGLKIAEASLSTWEDIVFYGGEFENGYTVSHGEVNLVDKNTNSLKQLNAYLSTIAPMMKSMQKNRDVRMDSTYTMPDSLVIPRPNVVPGKN
jgi:hypothetical protein